MKIMVTGGNGMLARAILAAGDERADHHWAPVVRADADLRDGRETAELIERVRPDVIVHTAARVGGIAANIAHPTEFLTDNLRIDTNVLEAAREAGVTRVVYFGSSCMYPRDYRQPLVESDVLAAPLEPTNEGYALSKIVAAKHCEYVSRQYGLSYRVLIPSNLYGPGDNYESGTSHLVAAAIVKAHAARENGTEEVAVWGDGTARREFTYTGDLAGWLAAHIDDMDAWPVMMNVGQGTDHTVAEFYRTALEAVGHEARLVFDPTKPAGMRQKLMDSSQARRFGWEPSTTLSDGMRAAYAAYLQGPVR